MKRGKRNEVIIIFLKKRKQESIEAEQTEQRIPEGSEMPDLTKEPEIKAEQEYDFHDYFEEEEPDSFRKSWRNIWQVILGAYGAFLPLFLTMFVALFLAFLLIRLFLL